MQHKMDKGVNIANFHVDYVNTIDEPIISSQSPHNRLINQASEHLHDFICKKKQTPSTKITIKTNAINILFLLSSIWILSTTALDTIPVNQPLNRWNYHYFIWCQVQVGIFFTWDIRETTVVWVANRDSPLNDTSSVLNLTRQGILTLINGSGRVIWSSNSTRHVENPIALLDSGNLVVRDDSTENYLWQSSDYPTDTALPGMKLGIDLKTGFRGFLRSWKCRNDPSKGEFSWVFDLRGFPQPFVMNGSIERYRSGPWNGRGFSNSPSQLPSPDYNYTYISDSEKVSFMYQLTERSILAR
ncbi:hypothetical protein H5410_005717 [Solanum commersonii]|uniref:Bulb-type lectin domain-containing protein n=1 Tax=Solanum commersonii TaxID=4109 RepID=A0A9J6A888_SOLCO|nr:hypothetical protein H5410_005717 [Solanum commersonii]